MCKQLNKLVLKSLKPICLGRNRKKNWPGPAWAKILCFVSDRTGLGPKFQFPFRVGLGSDVDFNFSFGPDRSRAKIFFCILGRAESRL